MVYYTSNKVYMALNFPLLAFILLLLMNAGLTYIAMGSTNFYGEKTQYELDGERRDNELRVTRSQRSVTGDDIDTLERYENINIEMTVVLAKLDRVSTNQRGLTEYESYSLVGRDETGFHWYVYIERRNENEPVPTEVYSAGTKIKVYTSFSGTANYNYEYVMEIDNRVLRVSGQYIEVVE